MKACESSALIFAGPTADNEVFFFNTEAVFHHLRSPQIFINDCFHAAYNSSSHLKRILDVLPFRCGLFAEMWDCPELAVWGPLPLPSVQA
jgi:hypothetical protein